MLEWGAFIELACPPAATRLPPLTGAHSTRQRVEDAFREYLNSNCWVAPSLEELPARSAPGVIYLFGHAWIQDATLTCAVSNTRTMSAREVLELIRARCDGPVLLIVDTCHAAAMKSSLRELRYRQWTVLFASAENESAFSFSGAGSRMSLALLRAARRLKKRRRADALDLYHAIGEQLSRPEVIAGQAISYWVDGEALSLQLRADSDVAKLPRPHLWLRSAFVVFGCVLMLAAIGASSYYYTHALIEIRVPQGLAVLATNSRITAHRADVDSGTEALLRDVRVPPSGVLNLRLPAENLILRFDATYADQKSRAMNMHVVMTPGWRLADKRTRWLLPSETEVLEHAEMAYVPAVRWLSGVAREETTSRQGFWIDLHPPRTRDYVAWLGAAAARGEIDVARSQIGGVRDRIGGLEATGLAGPLGQLMRDLKPALNQIDETVRRDSSMPTPSSAQITSLEAPCEECPALVTREEADAYCAARGMRVPTRSEWELSVRGVDGRAFPWGDRFVRERSNVIGLPEKWQAYELASVDAYKSFRSPFGLWDTIGNAGDWVDTEGGYPRAFAGGNYRFNAEDATVVSLLPDTGEVLSVWPNTVRCVDPAS